MRGSSWGARGPRNASRRTRGSTVQEPPSRRERRSADSRPRSESEMPPNSAPTPLAATPRQLARAPRPWKGGTRDEREEERRAEARAEGLYHPRAGGVRQYRQADPGRQRTGR